MRTPLFPVLLASLVWVGCAGDAVFEDSLGVRVQLIDGNTVALPGVPESLTCEGTTPIVGDWALYGGSHYVALCPELTASPTATDCRPLVCERDAQCPDGRPFYEPRCEGGLCVRSGEPLREEDVIVRCLADVPRQTDCSNPIAHGAVLFAAIGDAVMRSCDALGVCTEPFVCGP